MRKTWTLAIAILAAGAMHAEKLANGLEFRVPEGWTVRTAGEAALLVPPDMVMEPGGTEPSELYVAAVMPGIRDLQDPQLLSILQTKYFPAESQVRAVGTPRAFQAAGGAGYVASYDAVSQGSALRLEIHLVGLRGGGVAGLVAVARPALVMLRSSAIASVAASFSRQAAVSPTANGALAGQWVQKLRGHKLYQFSGYSGSYGSGGTNSQKTLLLAANGAFDFRRSSATSVYVSGASGSAVSQGGEQGRWRIYEQGGRALLELTPANGPVETIVLTTDGSKTFLNGNRWLVGD